MSIFASLVRLLSCHASITAISSGYIQDPSANVGHTQNTIFELALPSLWRFLAHAYSSLYANVLFVSTSLGGRGLLGPGPGRVHRAKSSGRSPTHLAVALEP